MNVRAFLAAAAVIFFAIGAGFDSSRRPPYGLVFFAPFNCGDAKDYSPYNATPTLAGNAVITAGNRYLTLDGTGDWVTTSDHAGLDVGDDFSVSFWVQPNAPGTGATRIPVARYLAGSSKRSWVVSFRYADTPQRIYGVVSGDGISTTIIYAFNLTLPTSGWHHVVMVYSKSNSAGSRVAMYYDGTALSVSTLINDSAVSPFATDIGVRIGNDNDGTASTAWKGDVDDVRLYNRALGSAESAQLYSAGRP